MEDQLIITVSREYGSGGHEIARKVAEDFKIPLYDRNMLEEISRQKNVDVEQLHFHDEKPRNLLITRTVRGHSSSMEDHVAQMQFDFIKEKAASGESFLVVGRCAETILREYKGHFSVFVVGDREDKLRRIMESQKISRKEAKNKLFRHDWNRRQYHNRYSDFRWGDSRHYSLCINSTVLGISKTAEAIENVIELSRQKV